MVKNMNDILQLKGEIHKKENTASFGPTNLKKGEFVTIDHLIKLINELVEIEDFWRINTDLGGALISVHYNQVVAKSNRLQYLLSDGRRHPNENVRGAKFVYENREGQMAAKKHIFTYFVSLEVIAKTINILRSCLKNMETYYPSGISREQTEEINSGKYNDSIIKKSSFLKIIVDVNHVEDFRIDEVKGTIQEGSIITVYKTAVSIDDLLEKIGISRMNFVKIDDTTLQLRPADIEILREKMPYLIAMYVRNLNDIDSIESNEDNALGEHFDIPDPTNEPIVGVIDTHFDIKCYFHKWVDYKNMLSEDFDITIDDKFHGTSVSSIIVDGPSLNPELDDGCGRFRVRHFGVALQKGFSSISIVQQIEQIVTHNTDIKVWNLSLGSASEINLNFISIEGSELDRIQAQYDVIFIVAGTNVSDIYPNSKRIGAPADSLNSLVVNAVDFKGNPTNYTRVGPVLSFFYKPDVAYYGGDDEKGIKVCGPFDKIRSVRGTSYAAPWITRKVAYLIEILGVNREIAKALIIDAAASWDRQDKISFDKGYGIVPIHINDIIKSNDDEIKFIMSGRIEDFEMYSYNIPVPQVKTGFPFFAKATLVYFPKSDRNQGVDYTSTEIDVHFGRVTEKNGKACIKPINYNLQSEEGRQNIYEDDARKLYRKWDNVKHINEKLTNSARIRKKYGAGLWGLSIKTKERLESKNGRGMRFGIVVTLKEMYGKNRLSEFIKLCSLRGWIVNTINVENQIDIINKSEEEIEFE